MPLIDEEMPESPSRVHPTRALVVLIIAVLGVMCLIHFIHFDSGETKGAASTAKAGASSTPAASGATPVADARAATRLRLLDEGKGAQGRVVFVNRPDGTLRTETKTNDEGVASFPLEDGDSVTVAYGTSRFELVTYLDVTSGETLLAGEVEDEEVEVAETKPVARFLVAPPEKLPEGAQRVTVSMGAGELDLDVKKGRELAIPKNRVANDTYFVVARALDKTGNELGVAVVRRATSDSSKLVLPPFERAQETFTVRLSDDLARAKASAAFTWNEAHFDRPAASCETRICRVSISKAMIDLGLTTSPHVRVTTSEGHKELELDERIEGAKSDVALSLPPEATTLLSRVEAPRWTENGGIEWPSAFPRTFTVIDVAWPQDTKAHTWRFVAPSERRAMPALALPASVAAFKLDDRSTSLLAVTAYVAPHLYDARFVRERSLEVLEDLPRGGRVLELKTGDAVH